MKCPSPIIGGASFAGKSKPKTSPNSFPPKYQEKTPSNDHAIAEKKNCLGFGKKLSNNSFSVALKVIKAVFCGHNFYILVSEKGSRNGRQNSNQLIALSSLTVS